MNGSGAGITAEQRLREIYEVEWSWRLAEFGAQTFSTHGPIDGFLPDVGEAAQLRRLDYWLETLATLAAIPIDGLSREAATDHAVYADQLATLIAQQQSRMYEWPANADTSFWGLLAERAGRTLNSEEEARRYLAQLSDIPRYFAQQKVNMTGGAARGFGPPRVSMLGREATIRSVIDAPEPSDVCFFAPFESLPATVPDAMRDSLREEAFTLISDVLIPAYQDLLIFVTDDYFPHLPTEIGASHLPDGDAFYRIQLREFTTTTLSPQEILDHGIAAVEAIRMEMLEIAEATGFPDDVPALLDFMRTDPQFYVSTPDALLREAAWHSKKFDARVHQYFGRTPRMRFGIVEPPADLAPFYTAGRGGLDRYTLNTYNLPARPLYSLPALTLHEAAPGHAFQTPFALEQTQHPSFRRHVYISAYGEGWALYCERLGAEMGMYETPYEIMGMLSYQMWRAVRLVIDPGMHAFGWSRERAQDFLRANTAISDHEIVTEVDRYIAWPGQATAYFIGEMKIIELRAKAETALGAEFDLRNFHDVVLALGSVPLTILEDEINWFIANGGVSPFAK